MNPNGTITDIKKGRRNGHRFQAVQFAHGAKTIACWGDDWGMQADGPDRWSVACETHGHVMEFATYSEARDQALIPGYWCSCCAEEIKTQAETVEVTSDTCHDVSITIDSFPGGGMVGDDDEQDVRRNGEIVGSIRKEYDEVGAGMAHEYRVGRYYVEIWDANCETTAEGVFEARQNTRQGLRTVNRPAMTARQAHAAAKRFARKHAKEIKTQAETVEEPAQAETVERDALREEYDAMEAELIALKNERADRDLDAYLEARRKAEAAVERERDDLKAERDDLKAERDDLNETIRQLHLNTIPRALAAAERGALTKERDALQAERDALEEKQGRMDAIFMLNSHLLRQKDAREEERDVLWEQLEETGHERDYLQARLSEMTEARDDLQRELRDADKAREEMRTQMNLLVAQSKQQRPA